MKYLLCLLATIAVVSAQSITCDSDKVYAKITKVTKTNAAHESFKILSGTTELYTSPTLENNAIRYIELCLDATTNNQYTLQMLDSFSNSWGDGAWISIEGINNNIVFKGMMVENTEETVQFSLYAPINKGDTWKYTASPAAGWNGASFDDQTWTDVITGGTTEPVVGAQYFRHAFAGVANLAAVEVQINYRFGVVAYINGVEIYRDNMPAGAVTAETTATSTYSVEEYRGVIRSSDVAEVAASVLAVEVHFLQTTYSEVIQFNAFLSMHAGLSAENNCFVLPQDPSVTHQGFNTPEHGFTWTRSSRAYTSTPGAYMTADYSASPALAHVNGFRLWPLSQVTQAVNSFVVSGSNTISGTYEELFSTSNNVYTSLTWKQWIRATPVEPHTYIRFTALAAQTSTLAVYEFQMMVCNIPTPTTITYTQTQTSFFANHESVELIPDVYGFSNCQVNPALPAGLTWNADSCSLSGVATEARAQTTYTVTGTAGTVTATGTFTLTFTECANSLYKIKRTYNTAPQNEYFRIYDSSNMNVIYEVLQDHSHSASKTWEHYLCIAPERFDVVFYHTGNQWQVNSYFYMYYLLPDNEQELVIKGRHDNFVQAVSNIYARRPHVAHAQQWYYKFDSVPANWYSSDVAGWSQAARGTFPTATNKVQLYKKTFNVNNINEVMGYVLSIRYKYGCIVYLNGQEAWRNGVSGEVGTAPVAESMYNDLKYRVVTLPGKTIATATEPTVKTFLQQGTNTIAIALVAIADTQTTTDFDCMVRLLPSEQSAQHMWEITGTSEGFTGTFAYAFSQYSAQSLNSNSATPCTTNNLIVILDNDRREWVSSIHIQNFYGQTSFGSLTTYDDPAQFKVYARNGDSEGWTLLKEVTGLTFSMVGQKRRIYFQNNKAYNQFKIEDIFPANHATQCKWRVQGFNLYADNVMAELEPLSYGTAPIEIYKDIEMSEIIPTGEGYSDFTITPALPEGVVLDPQSGWISGTASALVPTTTYTVTANKVTGGTATATVSITATICTGGRSLMTVRFRADANKSENSWVLYQGRGITGAALQQVDEFPVTNTYYYIDFCLNDGIYTFKAQDSFGDGWSANTGYTMTVDLGKMELEIQELDASATASPVFVTSVFSTFFPFQFEFTEWKVSQGDYVNGWNTVSFDDSTWTAMTADKIPTSEQITTYVRKTFTLTNVADYQVLNVRVKYTGGIACYFNGNLVARLNLEENFEPTTESITIHDAAIDGKFHIILPTSGVVEGTNVVAFEIHRTRGGTSSDPVVFDATGVFGVDDCNVVVDSYALVDNTNLISGTVEGIMDLDPYTTGSIANDIGVYIEWTVDNLLGSKWNTFNILLSGARTAWGFRIDGVMEPDVENPESIVAFDQYSLEVTGRSRPNFQVPVALAGFRKYRWEVTSTSAASTALNSMFQVYCKATGATCPGMDKYPAVGEGQISPASCPEGYKGYSYRECSGGQLGAIKLDHCALKLPALVRYNKNRFTFVKDTQVTTGLPTYRNIVTKWYVDTNVQLPEGLVLNQQTGEISGTPKQVMEMASYTIFAENASGVVSTIINISVRVGQCAAEGVFPVTDVDQTATYECSNEGAYVGTQKRACVLGAVDGEWQKTTGTCVSIVAIVVLILIVIIVIVIVVFVIMRTSRKAKAVGGVKGKKKGGKTMKTTTPKKNEKNVKV